MRSQSLEVLGFKPGHDVQHKLKINPDDLPPNLFFDQSNKILEKAGPIVLDEIVPSLEEYEGRWNPGGFMVFPLGIHDVLGSLRFHVYPEGISRETSQGPNIHNHAWHLFSRVLVGHYRDTIYDLENQGVEEKPNLELTEKGLLRLFQTKRNAGGKDVLVTDGTIIRPLPILYREVPAGQFHTIEANIIYHLTTIPKEQLAATLVLDSPAFGDTTDVLIDSISPQLIGFEGIASEVARMRRDVDHATAIFAKTQLMNVTSKK